MVPKRFLALEAATRRLSAAVFMDGACVSTRVGEADRAHSEILLSTVDAVLKEAGVGVAGLDAVAVTRGPGAFTSVRIGLATALGLAFPADRPVLAVSTLETMAYAARAEADGLMLVLLDARKGECYGALYRSHGADLPERLEAPDVRTAHEWWAWAEAQRDGHSVCVVGDGAHAYLGQEGGACVLAPARYDLPDAVALGELVVARAQAGLAFEPATPLYLRKPEAEINLAAAREGA